MNADSVDDVASKKAEHKIREPIYRGKKIVLGEIYVQLLLKLNLNRFHRAKAAEDGGYSEIQKKENHKSPFRLLEVGILFILHR